MSKRFDPINAWTPPLALLLYKTPYQTGPVTYAHWWRLQGEPQALSLTRDRAFLPVAFRVSSSWRLRPFVQLWCATNAQLIAPMPIECFHETTPIDELTFSVVPAGKRFEVQFLEEGGLNG